MALKRVRTKSSDIAGVMEAPKSKRESSPKNKRSPSPKDKKAEKDKQGSSPKISIQTNGINGEKHKPAKFNLKLISHGRVNGPIDEPKDNEEMLQFSVRDVPNPPAKLRKNYTGLSPRLRKEVFSDKIARQKYDTIVIEMENMMKSIAASYDAAHPDEVDEDAPNTLVISIQCEEGKHRSVSYAEELAQATKRKEWDIAVVHRDLGVHEQGGNAEDSDEEPSSPVLERPAERKTAIKKREKQLKRTRTQRLQIEVVGSGAEDGFF